MNKSDLQKLERFFKRSPKQFKAATANILNSLAFTTMNYDKINLKRGMITRSENFLKRSLKVVMAKGSHEINQQFSIAASMDLNPGKSRGTGWVEQEYGRRTKEKKKHTKYARGGSNQGEIKSEHRMKSRKRYLRASTMSPRITRYKDRSHRAYIFKLMLIRRNYDKPFIMRAKYGSSMRSSLFILEGDKLKKIATLGRPKQPKRFRWRTQSIKRLMSQNNIRNIWRNSLRHIIHKYK